MIDLPDTAIASSTEFIGTFTNDLWGIIALAIGIPLAFYIIDIIITLPNENDRELERIEKGVRKLQRGIGELEDFYK